MAKNRGRTKWRPTDRDLQAFVDGALDAKRRAEVRSALRRDPALREAVKRYEALRRDLHRLYDAALGEPVPEELATLLGRPPAKRRLN
jgi:anti-sigma factor RsiW